MKIGETSYDKDSNKRLEYFVETKYTLCLRKTRHLIVKIISSNLNRFSTFFHCWKVCFTAATGKRLFSTRIYFTGIFNKLTHSSISFINALLTIGVGSRHHVGHFQSGRLQQFAQNCIAVDTGRLY